MAKSEHNHVLVIRLSALGDVAMTIPVLSALTNQYPSLKITVLTKGFFRPMFSQLPNVTVYEANVKGTHKGARGLWKLYIELKKLQISGIADLHNVLRSNILKSFFKLKSIPFIQIDKGRAEKKKLTAARNKVFRPLKTTHERYADVFAQLGFPIDLSRAVFFKKEKLLDTALKLVGADTKKWIGVAPFAAFKGKMYPLELMEKVIQGLNAKGEYKILFFGGGKEEEKQLDMLSQRFPNSINIAGRLSFEEELALISNLDLMLSMDSGNGHLAAMYGIPTVTLWGVTHPYAGFYPLGQDPNNALIADRERFPLIPTSVYGNKFPKGYEKAIATITPDEVLKKIKHVLEK